jgi:hypothetical protein
MTISLGAPTARVGVRGLEERTTTTSEKRRTAEEPNEHFPRIRQHACPYGNYEHIPVYS